MPPKSGNWQAELGTSESAAVRRAVDEALIEAALARLAADYEFDDSRQVRTYLGQHPYLIDLLAEARRHLDATFGDATPVRLKVVAEPEMRDSAQLFALVGVAVSPREALARLEQFEQMWWLDAQDQARCRLTVSLEFIDAV